MTITHISEREQALERENEKMLQTVRIQAVTLENQEQSINELKADAARYRFIREGAFSGQWLLSEVQGDWGDGMDKTVDKTMAAMKETTS